MISLFKKKSEPTKQDSMPPLPEDLPEESNVSMPDMNTNNLPPLPDLDIVSNNTHDNIPGESTHDLIPNDISINNSSDNDVPEPDLPLLEDPLNLEETNNNLDLPTMPDIKTNELELPDLPSVDSPYNEEMHTSNPDVKIEEKSISSNEKPIPSMDDDIPEPPAIFSEDGFYETPNEVKHLVDTSASGVKELPNILQTTDVENVARIEIPMDTIDMQNKNYQVDGYNDGFGNDISKDSVISSSPSKQTNGPIFVDMNSFKTMINGIDTIKQDVKSSDEILKHLNQIKDSKDKELERWRLQLEDIQRKISYVDKVIFNEA